MKINKFNEDHIYLEWNICYYKVGYLIYEIYLVLENLLLEFLSNFQLDYFTLEKSLSGHRLIIHFGLDNEFFFSS